MVYDSTGNIVSCGTGGLDTPCLNTNPKIAPEMDIQASPNTHLYVLLYQPRGAWMVFQGNGTMEAPMQVITGFLSTTGTPTITLQPLAGPLTRRMAMLVE